MVHQQELHLNTARHGELHDLTHRISEIVRAAGVTVGLVNVFAVGSTAAIGCIEFEPGLAMDLPAALDRLLPPGRDYAHEEAWHDGNGHAHLQATLQGQSLTLPVAGGKPILGTWQQVFFLECDIKPRHRTVVVTVYGE